ncbi:hypothetical protein [Listeria booriae]|uniref:LXG domain-containing protein n=1 Tax=Listeria booriae TaxID=1552123 RepID=A0A7X0Z987_9LIST|nr:hypothetical protein [Listeria booriae]MBC2173989.1 hypothetical protein [Listeria booriae]MBC2178153.1 hypothetical protein [Listeria booriae]MBC2178320.1 hypothetical protein [Listeria booriae]
MADTVNLQASEYNELLQTLKSIHPDIIQKLTQAVKEIRELTGSSGSFQTETVSPKIASLMDAMNHDLIQNLEKLFTDSEASIEKFTQTISNCDTAC